MKIYDSIHGYIYIDPIAKSIIDTPIFQRLRLINQTGVLYLVYPTAHHSRFEHSIGTYFLAKQMITSIMQKQPELNINEDIIMLVSIAGLCHDLGHLMFSHLFDDIFLPLLPNYNILLKQTKNIHHENRSIFLLNKIVSKYKLPITKDQLKVIADLINPKDSDYNKWNPIYKVGQWIFQIISNPINSIDVDKFDYLVRDTKMVGLKLSFDYSRIINECKVINSTICYSVECTEDIYHMFFLRYRLHRQIYNDKTAKAIEILIVKLLLAINNVINISDYLLDENKMCRLVDNFIFYIDDNEEISSIINEIHTRKLPKLVYQDISINDKNTFDIKNFKEKFDKSTYEIVKFKVGYVGGKSNPLNHITFYDIKTGLIIQEKNTFHSFSLLINQKYQEYFFRIYCTDMSKYEDFLAYFNSTHNSNNDIISC
jgi:HD superfamily phosphohydrolase